MGRPGSSDTAGVNEMAQLLGDGDRSPRHSTQSCHVTQQRHPGRGEHASTRKLHTHVHSSVHNSQSGKSPSIRQQVAGEHGPAAPGTVTQPGQEQSDITCDPTHRQCPEQMNPQTQKVDAWFPRAGLGGWERQLRARAGSLREVTKTPRNGPRRQLSPSGNTLNTSGALQMGELCST